MRFYLPAAAAAVAGVFFASALTTAFAQGPPATEPSPTLADGLDFQKNAAQIDQACSREIARYRVRRAHMEHVPAAKRTFAGVIMPLENIRADFADALAAPVFLASVAVDKPVRIAARRCVDRVSEVQMELDASPVLYRVVLDAAKSATASTDAARKLTDMTLAGLRRSGAGLSAAKRVPFLELEQQLSELESAFQAQLTADAPSIEISADDVKSLPPEMVGALRRGPTGALLVPVDESHYVRFMRDESDAQARWRFLTAYFQRGGEANVRRLERAIVVRDRIAHLMGYRSWAAYVLADRMAGTPSRVAAFLDDLTARITPLAQAELARLTARKRKVTGDPDAILESWDQLYYANDLLKAEYSVDTDALRAYFPVTHTIDATLSIYSKLFGVSFVPREGAPLWSPDVAAYSVIDSADGAPRGTLYLDLFARPGKYPRFATFRVQPVRRQGEVLRPSVTAIVGNWQRPVPGKIGTLSHDEVVTFFHEFGHAMANLLSTAPYESLSGYRWDFIEAPAQMLENWTWDRGVLSELSANVNTGAPIPPAVADRLIATRSFNDATTWLTQVAFASVDLTLHSSGAHVDTTAAWKRQFAGLPFPQLPAGSIPLAGFGHLMSGYDVGYYGYVWSKVYAQDLFSAFRPAGLHDQPTGLRFRANIFEPSRTYEPDVLVARFLGRPATADVFVNELKRSTTQ